MPTVAVPAAIEEQEMRIFSLDPIAQRRGARHRATSPAWRVRQEALLDAALRETFPASDPVSLVIVD